MKLKLDFDENIYDEQKKEDSKPRFSPIPKGWYNATCVDFFPEVRENHVGGKVVFEILDGEYDGRKVFDYFICKHDTSEKAHEIGVHRLIDWAEAVGAPYEKKQSGGKTVILLDTDDLIDKECLIWLKIEGERVVNGDTKPAQNRISRVRGLETSPANRAPKTSSKPAKSDSDDLGDWT